MLKTFFRNFFKIFKIFIKLFFRNFIFRNFIFRKKFFVLERWEGTLAGSPLGTRLGKRSQCVKCVHTYRYDAYAVCHDNIIH